MFNMGEEYELDENFGDFGLQERALKDVTSKLDKDKVSDENRRGENKDMNIEDQLYGVPYNPCTIPNTSAEIEISNIELEKYLRR